MKIIFAFLILLAMAAPVAVAPAAAQTQQPLVLAELFNNFGCTNCLGNDDSYYSFVAANPSYGIVVISYHNTIPLTTDEFYKESSTDIGVRNNYYVISQDPTAIIDGYSAATTYQQWEPTTTTDLNPPLNPLAQAPKAVIESDGNIHIVFSATGPSSGLSKVRVAIKEDSVYFDNTDAEGELNPPGYFWNDIFRAMLPNSSDTTSLSKGETRSFDVVFDPNQYFYLANGPWITQHMEAVVFVQDDASDGVSYGNINYAIESIGVVSLANPALLGVAQSPAIQSASIRVVGIPSNPQLRVSLPSSDRVGIEISDMLGRQARVIPEVIMPSGETSVDMSGSPLPAGCYFARMTVDGQEAENVKFIVAP